MARWRFWRRAPSHAVAGSKIRDVTGEGQAVTVVGTAHLLGEGLHAPLSGWPCVAWQVVVDERAGLRWRPEVTESCGAEFYLLDDTGRAFIRVGAYATIHVRHEAELRSGMGVNASDGMREFLARHGQEAGTRRGIPRTLRFRERVVRGGVRIAATGLAWFEPDPTPDWGVELGYRQTPTRLVLRGTREAPLLLTDDAEDG